MSVSLYALLAVLFPMKVLTFSGSSRLQFLCRCLSRFPTALVVVSAYAFLFMYRSTFGMLMSCFVWDGV